MTRHLAREDQLIEWVQVGLLCAALWMTVRLALRWRKTRGTRRIALLALGAAAALTFIVGEEISWGQRVIGFETPEQIGAVNAQGEFNFHNSGFLHDLRNYLTLGLALCGLLAALVSGPLGRSDAPLWLRTLLPAPEMVLSFALFLCYGIALAILHLTRAEGQSWDLGRTVAEWSELMFCYCAFLFAFLKAYRFDVALPSS